MANKTMGQSFPSGYDKIQQQSSAEVVGVVLVKVPHFLVYYASCLAASAAVVTTRKRYTRHKLGFGERM